MKGVIQLEDGQFFEGHASGEWASPVEGEVVFYTGMTGYQEVLTDPSYRGQIVVFTYPLIGNYGVSDSGSESEKPQVKGAIMWQCSDEDSHYQADQSLAAYMEEMDIPYLTNIDTREITKAIRTKGTCRASIANTPSAPAPLEAAGQVFEVSKETIEVHGDGGTHLVLIDFGWKQSILDKLLAGGAKVTTVPFRSIADIHGMKPDGIVLSNGPGDPKDVTGHLGELKALLDEYPAFGICYGHQVISLAYGADTEKLPFGHRGANHPVKDLKDGHVFITSQNHNYVVTGESLEDTPLEARLVHVNDGSVEGVVHKEKPIFSAQFHPEANPGPEDAEWMIDEFFTMVQKVGVTTYV
ncbi:carbamoyl phosphate synthase small subunit [Salimicrobium flavidum]|uniref:Carbamoyl phosphate synthase small chain n=1 Tax=Salimicrobium flavidum TaxID=570947 RepID=A0A1N7ITB2_9BACI|nr:carbamoyl phosphate synthase small subunit [Salimicrobium flavidum]SIS40335.1 carbamoyl-phosphate synthase small subunit [Salimicrobium flavidum]